MRDISSTTTKMLGNRVIYLSEKELSLLVLACMAATEGFVLGTIEEDAVNVMISDMERIEHKP